MGAIATDARPAAASPIKSIQRGEVTFSFAGSNLTQTVSITAVDMSKSTVGLLTNFPAGRVNSRVTSFGVRLTSTTQLSFKQGNGFYAITAPISYEVIEYL